MKWKITLLAAAILVFISGYLLAGKIHGQKKNSEKQEAVILIEQIRSVIHLATVEARFSELYTYSDYKKFDWQPFKKKAILRIRGKVTAGVDLSGVGITPDPEKKIIRLERIPKPQIMHVEQDIDYYDLKAGVFNDFRASDHTRMQEQAKSMLMEKAKESRILEEANKRSDELLVSLKSLAKHAGWTLEIKE